MTRYFSPVMGFVTAAVFFALGIPLLGEDQGRVGALLLGLGLMRAGYAAHQLRLLVAAGDAEVLD